MCGGGGGDGALLGAAIGAGLAYATGGASLGLTAGKAALAGGAVGATAGSTMIDQPAAMKKGIEAQQQATKVAVDAAEKQAKAADQEFNRVNAKTADVGGMAGANMLTAKGGNSGTTLTGSTGVDPASLLLGKKTLLGG